MNRIEALERALDHLIQVTPCDCSQGMPCDCSQGMPRPINLVHEDTCPITEAIRIVDKGRPRICYDCWEHLCTTCQDRLTGLAVGG